VSIQSPIRALALTIACLAFVVVVATAGPASAHEGRTVAGGTFKVECGWGAEPAHSNVMNSVQFFLNDSHDKPVTDAGEALHVVVSFGTQKSGELVLKPAFGPGYGTPGEYDAAIIPTRPGTYSFHVTGTVRNTKIDETFTSSDKTFDDIAPAKEIEFPVQDPTPDELAAKVDQLEARGAATAKAEAKKAKDDASKLALAGIFAGLVGIVVGGAALAAARRSG
jgi:hypothetical protein